MHRYNRTTHNQLPARVDSQINFSVVVHGRMQDLQRGATIMGGHACPKKKILMVQFGAFWSIFS